MRQILPLIVACLFAGCATSEPVATPTQPPAESQVQKTTQKPNQNLDQNATKTPKSSPKLTLNGALLNTFHTVLPCADCDGQKTILTLNRDKSYEKITLQLGKNEPLAVQHGKFELLSNTIRLKSEDGKIELYAPKGEALVQLDERGEQRSGVLGEVYRFEPVGREYKEGFYALWSKFDGAKSFQKIAIAPSGAGAKFSLHTNIDAGRPSCELSGELRYERGIFYFTSGDVRLSLHRLDGAIYVHSQGARACQSSDIAGKYTYSQGLKWLFGGDFLGALTPASQNADIVRHYGAKNIKKDILQKGQNRYVVLDAQGSELFKYELSNGAITRLEVLSPNFRSPEGLGLGSKFSELKERVRISDTAASDGYVAVKVSELKAVFKFELSSGANLKSTTQPNLENSKQVAKFDAMQADFQNGANSAIQKAGKFTGASKSQNLSQIFPVDDAPVAEILLFWND